MRDVAELAGLVHAKELATSTLPSPRSDELSVSAQQVALAWELAQSPVLIPIPGAKRASSITDSAAEIELTKERLARLDDDR